MAEIIPFAPDQVNTCVGSVDTGSKQQQQQQKRQFRRQTGSFLSTLVFISLFVFPVSAWETNCSTFREIYKDGKDLCERMWGESFVYSKDEDKAYTMWWFGGQSPNRQAAGKLGLTVPATCELQYFHKQKPTPESDDFTECLPWKEEACCTNATVTTADALKKSYGAGYEWDRCGPMSPECERFFVQESCFYECDVTAGLYRKCSDEQVAAASDKSDPCYQNTWEISKMPIKASYCDAWFNSCRNDYFCNGGGSPGNFFSCNAFYWENKQKAEKKKQAIIAKNEEELTELEKELDKKLDTAEIVGIVIAFIVPFAVFIGYIIFKEKKGRPVFTALPVPTADDVE